MHVAVGAAARTRFCAGMALIGLLLAPARAWPSGASVAPAAEAVGPSAPADGLSSRVGDPAPDPLRAWSGPGDLVTRAERARLAALQVGVSSFDAPARSLILDGGEEGLVDRARAAVLVAPELPLAHAALASALLRQRHDVGGAISSAFHALEALPQHREARLWLEAVGSLALRNALFFGALAFLAGLTLIHARAAAHDVGDRITRSLPLFARTALLGVVLLLPSILGQGLLGLGLACFTLALVYGGSGERRAASLAAVLLIVGLEAGSLSAARALVALDPDPVASALQLVERGISSQNERVRLEQAAATDPLAARGLALQARRDGHLAEAAQRYEALLASGTADATLANNAANVWIALGDADRAVALYELAEQLGTSPVVLYNLSYGYGQAIRPRAQDETLERLQRVDPTLGFDLTQLQAKLAGGFTLDLGIPLELFRQRAAQGHAVEAVALDLQRSLAPGVLGREPMPTFAAFLVAAFLARLTAGRFRRSSACRRCGGRLCPRCDAAPPAHDFCGACQRLFERPETTDPERRSRRLAELERRSRWVWRAQLAGSFLLPGAAGLVARRPWLGLAGSLAFCATLAFAGVISLREVVDPLAAGGAGALALGVAQGVSIAFYAVFVGLALRWRGQLGT